MDFEFSIAGLIVGLAVGMTGVGGGALMTPILIYLGVNPATAVGTDLLFAAITKGFGVTLQRKVGNIDWRTVFLMGLGSFPAAGATLWWLHDNGIDDNIQGLIKMSLLFAIVLTAVGVLAKTLLQRLSLAESFPAMKTLHSKLQLPATVMGGVALGVLVTLSSVGAGVIGTTILLLLYPSFRAVRVVGTDLAHAVPLTLVAGLGHLQLGTTDMGMLGWLLLGSVPGMYLGTKLGWLLPDRALKPVIALMLIIAAAMMFLGG